LDDALEILQRMDMDEDMVSETVTPINVKFPWWLVRKKGLRQVQRWYLSRLSKMGKEPSDYVFFHSKKSQRKNPGTRGIQRVLDSWSNTVEKKGDSLSKGVRLKKKARYPWASFVVDLSAEENNLDDILRMRSGDMTAHQSSNNYPLLRLRGGGKSARPSSQAPRPPRPNRAAQSSAEKQSLSIDSSESSSEDDSDDNPGTGIYGTRGLKRSTSPLQDGPIPKRAATSQGNRSHLRTAALQDPPNKSFFDIETLLEKALLKGIVDTFKFEQETVVARDEYSQKKAQGWYVIAENAGNDVQTREHHCPDFIEQIKGYSSTGIVLYHSKTAAKTAMKWFIFLERTPNEWKCRLAERMLGNWQVHEKKVGVRNIRNKKTLERVYLSRVVEGEPRHYREAKPCLYYLEKRASNPEEEPVERYLFGTRMQGMEWT
jgi:hypothetical protein